MTIDQLRDYCLSKKGVTEEFPFDTDTLVFKVAGKIFALFPLQKWEACEGSVNLKADPNYSLELRVNYNSIEPGWHMSKKHWNTIFLFKNECSQQFILSLIDHSYELVVKGLPKKLKDNLT